MIAAQEILLDVTGQELVLEHDAAILSVTSVSVRELTIDDTADAEAATVGVPAVDATADTTSVDVGPTVGPSERAIPVGDGSAFEALVGRRFLIAGGGRWEQFALEAVDGDTLYARHPLVNDYESGADVTGNCRATIGVSDTWASDITKLSNGADPNARWRTSWQVQLATGPMIFHRNFHLVRIPAQPPVGPIDVDDAFPGWLDKLPPDHQKSQGRPLILEAARAVRLDLWRQGIADHALRDAEIYAELVIAKAVYLALRLQRMAGSADAGQLEVARQAYEETRSGLVRTPVVAIDRGSGGGATTTKGRGAPLTVR